MNRHLATLIQLTAEANSALIRGDIDRYITLIEHAEDYTLMAPFGGAPTHGFDTSSQHREAMARLFKSGTFEQEVVATFDTDDLIVLVTIERVRAEVGELPEQDWSLRVTQVFRREGTKWHLVHRHADPLVHAISLDQATTLARGNHGRKLSILDDLIQRGLVSLTTVPPLHPSGLARPAGDTVPFTRRLKGDGHFQSDRHLFN